MFLFFLHIILSFQIEIPSICFSGDLIPESITLDSIDSEKCFATLDQFSLFLFQGNDFSVTVYYSVSDSFEILSSTLDNPIGFRPLTDAYNIFIVFKSKKANNDIDVIPFSKDEVDATTNMYIISKTDQKYITIPEEKNSESYQAVLLSKGGKYTTNIFYDLATGFNIEANYVNNRKISEFKFKDEGKLKTIIQSKKEMKILFNAGTQYYDINFYVPLAATDLFSSSQVYSVSGYDPPAVPVGCESAEDLPISSFDVYTYSGEPGKCYKISGLFRNIRTDLYFYTKGTNGYQIDKSSPNSLYLNAPDDSFISSTSNINLIILPESDNALNFNKDQEDAEVKEDDEIDEGADERGAIIP